MRYASGGGLHAQQTVDGQGDPTVYLHGDMVRSTMLMTDETGSAGVPPASLAYTAFGEPVTYDAGSQTWRVGFPAAGGTRYGYAGGFGYESGLITLQGVNPALPPVTLQHVGERWYDPALGRFVQRDPIGLSGGTNTYTYCSNSPLAAADPTGLATDVGQNVPDGWKPAGGLYGPPTPPGGFPNEGFGGYQPAPSHPIWPGNVETEKEARDIANAAAWTIACIAVFGGPPGWIVGGCAIIGAYGWDYIDRKGEGLYDPPTAPNGGIEY